MKQRTFDGGAVSANVKQKGYLLMFLKSGKADINLAASKMLQSISIIVASAYLTFIVDVYTLNTTLKRVFVFGYFVVMCALVIYLRKRFIKRQAQATSCLPFIAVLVCSVSIIVMCQDIFLPLDRSHLITLQAEENGEVWLTEVEVDGESVPLSSVEAVDMHNWEYLANYDDYVYYPGNENLENALVLDIVGQEIRLKLGMNSWSGTVSVTSSNGGTENLELFSEKESVYEYTTFGIRNYTTNERLGLNLAVLILLIFFLDTIFIFLQQFLSAVKSVKLNQVFHRVKKWRWYHWLVFLLVDTVITFQYTAQFLFMDIWQTKATLKQIFTYLFATVGFGIGLLIFFSCVDRIVHSWAIGSQSKASISEQSKLKTKRWVWITTFIVFLSTFSVFYRILPTTLSTTYKPSEVTLTILTDRNEKSAGHEILLSKSIIVNGMPTELTPINIAGTWNTSGAYFWGYEPGCTVTFSLPEADDIDLRFNKHQWSGMVEIKDGPYLKTLDLYSDSLNDYLESYHIRGNSVSTLSLIQTILLACLVGAIYSGIYFFIIYATLNYTSTKVYQLALFLSACSIWALYLLAGNPGGISIDTLNQFAQAKGDIPITDGHPALLTMLYQFIFMVIDSPIVFSIIQIVCFATVVSSFLNYLSMHGIRRKWLSIFCVLFSAHIVNGIYASILWKDIPYTICLLWLTLLLTKLGIERQGFFSLKNMVQYMICAPLTVLLRHNGIVVFIMLGGLLVGIAMVYHSWRPIVTLLCGVLIFAAIKGPVYTNYGIEPSNLYTPYGMLHGMVYTRLASKQSVALVDELMSEEDWTAIYEPYSANSFAFADIARQNNLSETINSYSSGEIVKEYVRTFSKHPFLIIKDRLFGCNLLWNSIPSGYNWRVANDVYDVVVENNYFGFYCKENALTDAVNYLYHQSLEVPLMDMLIWRTGPYVTLVLALLFLALEHKKYQFIFSAIPFLGNSVSLILTMSWQDYRYVYFAMVCACFLMLCYLALPDRESS